MSNKDESFPIERPPQPANAVVTIDQPPTPSRHRHRGGYKGTQLEYTVEDRNTVRLLAFYGVYPEHICKHIINRVTGLPIGLSALTRHFAKELEAGSNEGDRTVARSLFQHMEGRPAEYMTDTDGNLVYDPHGRPIVVRAEVRPSVAAPIFMSKTRRGLAFRETTVIEHTKSVDSELADALQPLSLEEKKQLRGILEQREEVLREQRRKERGEIEDGVKKKKRRS